LEKKTNQSRPPGSLEEWKFTL